MQTSTKNHRAAARTWRALIPLLVLLVSATLPRLGWAQTNSSIVSSAVIIDRGNGNETFGGKNAPAFPAFTNVSLGTFDLSNFSTQLLLNGGTIITQEGAPDIIIPTGSTITYRIRRNNSDGTFTAIGAPAPVTLPQVSTSAGTAGTTNRTFTNIAANQNILTGLNAGNYSLSVQFTVNGTNNSGDEFTLTDPPGTFYRANFLVTGVRPLEGPNSTTWTGGKNDNWFDSANWTQGVPTTAKDATIPDFGSGSTVPYPNIYSDAIKPNSTTTTTVNNPDGTVSQVVVLVPGYNNTGSGPAKTRGLNMQGTSQLQRSIARLNVGRLEVYGDFSNEQDSFIQRENTTISFTGGNQTISGSASGFSSVEIDGSGVKTLVDNFAVAAGGQLRFISGILATNTSSVVSSFVELAAATQLGNDITPAARLVGETETSYLRGFIKTTQPAVPGQAQDFSNIGLTLTFLGNDPGNVTVTRNTGANYTSISNGSNNKPSVRRVFGVRPSNQQTSSGGLSATLVFNYLNNELTNLEPNAQALTESNLGLFVSTSSGDTFGQLGRDNLNTTTNQLTKLNVTSFATFTLSELTSPLPVTLTAFAAKRVGPAAEITWETVNETNNKGYEVQVSNDGRTFRRLTFVASSSANSTRLLRYRYLDTEDGKAGVRYYRLRQIDLDGKETFYGPKVVSFAGIATADAKPQAYPNPFRSDVRLTVQAAAEGQGQLTLTDMTGRVVRTQATLITAGTNDLELLDLAGLQNGAYLLRVVLPEGKTQNLRVMKN